MKLPIIPILAGLLLVRAAFAQGTLSFSSSLVITEPWTGQPLGNSYRAGLYYSLNTNGVGGNPYLFNGTLLATTTFGTPIPGRFVGGVQTVPGAPTGSFIAVQIRVWMGPYATYEDMIAAGVYDFIGNCVGGACDPRGLSNPFIVGPLGGIPEPPALLSGLQPGFMNVAPIPEPSAVALAVLGALAASGCVRRGNGARSE